MCGFDDEPKALPDKYWLTSHDVHDATGGAVGGRHALLITKNSIMLFGSSSEGQLGHPIPSAGPTFSSAALMNELGVPRAPDWLISVAKVAAGAEHSIILLSGHVFLLLFST